ncbi:hypothetical protein AB6D11_02640 [Vibrio splendidus]
MSIPNKESSQGSKPTYQCPQENCRSSDLSVEITGFVTLKQHNGCTSTDSEGLEGTWDNSSMMTCNICSFTDESSDFKVQ